MLSSFRAGTRNETGRRLFAVGGRSAGRVDRSGGHCCEGLGLLMLMSEFAEHYQRIVEQGEGDRESCRFFAQEMKSQRVSTSEFGPVCGLLTGYAHNAAGLNWRFIEMVIRFYLWLTWSGRPGYNDFLMAWWNVCRYEESIVRKILNRTKHPTPAVSGTAVWMINSVCEQDPGFRSIVERLRGASR